MIINFILFTIFVLFQSAMYIKALNDLENKGNMNCHFNLTINSVPILLICFIVMAIIWKPMAYFVIAAALLLSLVQIGIIIYNSIKQREFKLGLILIIFYFFGIIGTVTVIASLVGLTFLIALIIFGLRFTTKVAKTKSIEGPHTIIKDENTGECISVDEFGYGGNGHKYGKDGAGNWERKR